MSIQDFGEKIGGAKKDLWKQRGLLVSDTIDMNEAEQDKHIKKDNIWKKPDYEQLVSEGVPIRVVYFMKLMRDSVPTKPVISISDQSKIKEQREGYIEFVSAFRDKVMQLRKDEDIRTFYKDVISEYLVNPDSYRVTLKPEAFNCISNKMLNAAYSVRNGTSILDHEIKKKQFCYSEDQKILAPYSFHKYDKAHVSFTKGRYQEDIMEYKKGAGTYFYYPSREWVNPDEWKDETYFIERNGKFFGRNFETIEDAKNYILEKVKEERGALEPVREPRKKKRKKAFVPKQLKDIKRKGSDNRNDTNIVGEDYLKVFNFKGGEFGNWLNEKDRQASLDFGYDALLDLCEALGIDSKDIALGNRLSIAFGARGSGNALAHYEPLREVINITKMKGAGSLAHEWGHALDDILGKKLGLKGMMSEHYYSKEVPESFQKLIKSMRYKEVCDESALQTQKEEALKIENSLRNYLNSYFPRNLDKNQNKIKDELVDKVVEAGRKEGLVPLEMVITGNGCSELDELSSFRKSVLGNVIPKAGRIEIAHYLNRYNSAVKRIGERHRVRTDFYENSIKFDSMHAKTDHGYYQSMVEMFARAFACYVKDKLQEKGIQSDYLCGHADLCVSISEDRNGDVKVIKAIPDGEERKAINKNFDDFFRDMKEKQMLHPLEKLPEASELKKYKKPLFNKTVPVEPEYLTLDEKIRRSRESDEYIRKNLHETKKGQLEFNLNIS